ncbi:atp-dependent rna helicase suv3 [Moniliophthora roreri]|nr:atp-dependent rna helicase suv3 [Moniliophthora roreri]
MDGFPAFRSGDRHGSNSYVKRQQFGRQPSRQSRPFPPSTQPNPPTTPKPPSPTLSSINQFLESYLQTWQDSRTVHDRLERFGIPDHEIPLLLQSFVRAAQRGELNTPDAYTRYALVRYSKITKTDVPAEYYDMVTTSVLYAWATHSPQSIHRNISPDTLKSIMHLHHATSIPYPADRFDAARRMRRHFIMHVGPTNSGKTHNALRALAASEAGVYAGPLRLLAHEIWERLNTGKIVPLNAQASSSSSNGIAITSSLGGNPSYIRQCNLVTGEAQKIVSDTAPLLSCTIEMLPPSSRFNIVVIDEIQMIGDPGRGYAWTNAVLGICAPEIHLCGEETAVPVIQALLKGNTNDTLEIRRYERLSPLTVSTVSLQGDLANVKQGDCIVGFSRRDIFKLKKAVEEKTKMKCAVVYGKLPPEIRSRQAELFNDPESGYDVLIGSDAIGMGLNLKINRVIFSSTSKFDGKVRRALTVSQVKQIAGRAGRFSADSSSSEGGVATTLHPQDLPSLAMTLAKQLPPIPYVVLSPGSEHLNAASRALPSGAGLGLCMEAHRYIGVLGAGDGSSSGEKTNHDSGGLYRYADLGVVAGGKTVPAVVDSLINTSSTATSASLSDSPFSSYSSYSRKNKSTKLEANDSGISFSDRMLLALAPLPWKENRALPYITALLQVYGEDYSVPLLPLLNSQGPELLGTLDSVLSSGAPSEPGNQLAALDALELLHRLLTSYSWLSYRQPVAFHDSEAAHELQVKTEKALRACLKGMTRGARGARDYDEQDRKEGLVYWDRHEDAKRRMERLQLRERS